MITAPDELRHPTGEGINWSESYFFTFYDPVREMAGYFRVGMQANKRQSNMWCHLMRGGRTIYHSVNSNLPYTDAGLDDLMVGGLRLKLEEPLKSSTIGFEDRHLSVDLRWEGFHDVVDFHRAMTGLTGSVAKGHYEQSGEVRGRISLGDDITEVHGYGFRDHSWGVRDWEAVKHWKAFTAQFGRDLAFAGVALLDTSGNAICLGFLFDGKETRLLRNLVAEVDSLSAPEHGTLRLEDQRGEVTTVEVEFTLVNDIPHNFNVIHECYARYRIGDRVGYGTYEINRRYQGAL